jgi:SPP1 family holin
MNTKSIAAIIVGVLSLVNLALSAMGVSPLPLDAEGIAAGASAVLALASGVVTTWYNFSVTEPAKVADNVLKSIKSGQLSINEVLELLGDIKDAASCENSKKCEGTD